NRRVAGAALGLVVVEAAQRSGSLISARLAGDMGRLVFAVPGSPLDPRAAGTNGLLKDGATLVTEASDISRAILPLTGMRTPDPPPFEDPPDFSATAPPGESDRAKVIEALGPTPVPVDEIIRHTGLHPAQVFMVLLELDLAGRLERHAGGNVSLVFGDG
ncbi:DNA-processing protein DprA, partial [Mesorhizobium sp. M2D.F.Ca.ET.145.01.1.1]